jgi:hypothetical protein
MRIDASRVVALVQYPQPCRYLTNLKLPSATVRSVLEAIEVKGAVAASALRAAPDMAATCGLELPSAIEVFDLGHGGGTYMSVRESAIETYLIRTVVSLGGCCYKFAVPGVRGYPDQIVKLPGADAFLVELKRPKGGRLAELQKVRHAELRAVGWRVYVAKDRGEIDAIIRRETGE